MRKGIKEIKAENTPFSLKALKKIESEGYRFVQVKGLTLDKHYDYVDPHFLVLVPMKELPLDQDKKDIYEPIESDLLQQWAVENDEHMEIVIAHSSRA